jgi:hypothetical protein
VRAGHAARDGQAQAGAAGGAGARAVGPEERVEDARQVVVREARAIIGDVDRDRAVASLGGEGHA